MALAAGLLGRLGRNRFLMPDGRRSHEDQAALTLVFRIFQPNIDVNAIGPEIDILLAAEITMVPHVVLLAPDLLEPYHDVGTEALCVCSQQGLQSLLKIAGRNAFQIQPGNQLIDRHTASQVP